MSFFKTIAVCHGKSCTPAGASAIEGLLKNEYADQSVSITECTCCGRCERSCTIVVDGKPVSDLTPQNLKMRFLDNPAQALADAAKRHEDAASALDTILSDDFLQNNSE